MLQLECTTNFYCMGKCYAEENYGYSFYQKLSNYH